MSEYYARSEYTGTGLQSAFTLSASRGSTPTWSYISASDVHALLNGVESTSFTLDGDTLTFTSAPSNGTEIILYRQTSLNTVEDFESLGTPSSGGFNQMLRRVQYIAQENADLNVALGLGIETEVPEFASVLNQQVGTSIDVISNPATVAALWKKGTNIASASTISLPATGGGYFEVTGTTTITGMSASALLTEGHEVELYFQGALTLTHHASTFILPTGANITTAAGDVARFRCIGELGYWRCVSYTRKDGSALAGTVRSIFSLSSGSTVGSSSGQLLLCTGTFTLALTPKASLVPTSGWYAYVRNDGTGIITIDPDGVETIDGSTTIAVYPGESFTIVCDGTSFKTIGRRKGLVTIQTQTASSVASVDFTAGIGAEFDEYELHYNDVMPATDGAQLWLRVTKDGGSNWRSTAGDYSWHNGYFNTASGTGNSSSDTEIEINRAVGNAANEGCAGVIRFWNPSGTSRNKWFMYDGSHVDNTGLPERSMGRGQFILDNNAINGIRLLFNSGNISSGTFTLYGVRK